MLVISNAGPLISLARVKQFHLLRQIYDHLTLPQAVYEEVVINGASRHGAAEVQSGSEVGSSLTLSKPLQSYKACLRN